MDDGRHEEALSLLYRARAADPDNSQVRQGINHLKALLERRYAELLGGLDRVVPPLPDGARSAEALMLSRFIDGVSTFGDIAEMFSLGRLRTLQLLVKLYVPSEREQDEPTSSLLPSSSPSSGEHAISSTFRNADEDLESAPQTARSPSSTESRGLGSTRFDDPASDAAVRYKQSFERGTTAFVQERYQDAVDAFGACMELREKDKAASVMLRRALQGLKSQVT